MNKATLLLGGNQGDRRRLLQQATELIQQSIGSVVLSSSIYETEPWGTFGEQTPQRFLNRALQVETELTAHEVLEEALVIEAVLGRLRPTGLRVPKDYKVPKDLKDPKSARVYHSRPMDIDIIFFNDEVIDEPDLQIPHPRMHLRRFVLEPLAEIMPDYRHPVLGLTVRQLLERNPILNTVTSEVLKN